MDFEDFQLQQSLQNVANTTNTMEETEAASTTKGQIGEQNPDPQMNLLADDMAFLGKKKKKPKKKPSNLVSTDDKENQVCMEETSGEGETVTTYEQVRNAQYVLKKGELDNCNFSCLIHIRYTGFVIMLSSLANRKFVIG